MGDRQANSALRRIVLVRMRSHQPTKEEIVRCPSATSPVRSSRSAARLTPVEQRPRHTRQRRQRTRWHHREVRWAELRRLENDGVTVRLLRRESMIPVPRSVSQMFIPRRLWRVEASGSAGVSVVVQTNDEATAWSTYPRESGDER
jgi:hypothetical protein